MNDEPENPEEGERGATARDSQDVEYKAKKPVKRRRPIKVSKDYPAISDEELGQVLTEHEAWLGANGKEGKRAALRRRDLLGANLREANLAKAAFVETLLSGADLQRANLQGAKLERANLANAKLNGADLSNASLTEADLCGADLEDANLQGAMLERARLAGTKLSGADLSKASLISANLEKADLEAANLSGANLRGANLQGANLEFAQLRGAFMESVDLQQANLMCANLQAAELPEAKLRGAVLIEAMLNEAILLNADLENAKLGFAKLQSADLTGTNLQHAEFDEADLRNAVLRNADLTGAKGFQAGQLAGTDLTSATLPDDIAKFEGLGHVEQISKHSRNIFLAVIGGCVYSWLTIATTTDTALLTNTVSTPLPIIQTQVPIAGFYWAAPVFLLTIYLYLHIYLQRMWEGLASLPAVFPDGRSLDERAYPWLLGGLVRAHVPLLREDRPAFSRIQVGLSI